MAEKFSGRVNTFRKFVAEEDNISWLIERLLPAVGKTLIVGPPAIGKTTLALQMCAAIHEGKPFMHRQTMQTKVLYIQLDSSDVEWREIIRRVAPESTALTLINAPIFCLDIASYVLAIKDLIYQTQPGFIVWDSLYKLSAKGVNGETVRETISQLGDLSIVRNIKQRDSDPETYRDVPLMVLHHPPQNGSARASGHNSLEATFSNCWFLTKTKLLVNKGWLVEDREVIMHREKKHPGLWHAEDEQDNDDDIGEVILNRPLR